MSRRPVSKPVTRHCDQCRYFVTPPVPCGVGHRPRFFMPHSPNDTDWGWKRACDDYRPLVKQEATQ